MYFFISCSKQKTAYEMRISDWSSYVCSSDLPDPVPTLSFTDAAAAFARLRAIQDSGTSFLRERFEAHLRGQPLEGRVRACYPFVRIGTATHARVDSRLSYGFVSGPGRYQTTEIGRASCRERVCQYV